MYYMNLGLLKRGFRATAFWQLQKTYKGAHTRARAHTHTHTHTHTYIYIYTYILFLISLYG